MSESRVAQLQSPHPRVPPVALPCSSSSSKLSLVSSVDIEDVSSDDGDVLETPLTDHHDQTAFIHGFSQPMPLPSPSSGRDAEPQEFSYEPYSQYNLGTAVFQSKAVNHLTSSSFNPSSPSHRLASPPTSPDFQSNSARSSVKKHTNRQTAHHSHATSMSAGPVIDQNVASSLSYYRNKPTGFSKATTMPRLNKHIKPKLLRSPASEYIPATLGRVYSKHFPAAHRLVSDFVHAYQLREELGSGGYGFVMTARHRFEGYNAAVKFIIKDKVPAHAWTVDNSGSRVPMEAKMLSLVRHEGIVKFYDLFEDESYFYLVQELHGIPWPKTELLHLPSTPPCASKSQPISESLLVATNHDESYRFDFSLSQASPCKDLQHDCSPSSDLLLPPDLALHTTGPSVRPQYMRRPSHDLFEYIEQCPSKRLSEEDARYIFAQVVDIVDYLDGEGVSHRDIKDENLIIDAQLKVKLIDFGSVVIADPTQPRPYYDLFFGTTAYASSEILRKKPYQAAPAEIWTLGILLSYLITGASPFPTRQHAIDGAIVLGTVSDARVPAGCLHLMTRCLEPDPEKRADIKEVKEHPWVAGARTR